MAKDGVVEEFNETDRKFMDMAFVHALKALTSQEVPVGCIFVHDNEVIAVGSNTVNLTKNATRHAELNCIDRVLDYCTERAFLNKDDFFRHVSVYVTVEPCIMCMAALYDLNVKEIVYGCKNDRFGGETVFDVGEIYGDKRKNTKIKGGYKREEAMNLLKEFYKGTNPSAPLCKVKIKK